jgi:hypothetical protein
MDSFDFSAAGSPNHLSGSLPLVQSLPSIDPNLGVFAQPQSALPLADLHPGHFDMIDNSSNPPQTAALMEHALANGLTASQVLDGQAQQRWQEAQDEVRKQLASTPAAPALTQPTLNPWQAGLAGLGAILDSRHAAADIQGALQGVSAANNEQNSRAWQAYEAQMGQHEVKLRALQNLADQTGQEAMELGRRAAPDPVQQQLDGAVRALTDPGRSLDDKLQSIAFLEAHGVRYPENSLANILGPTQYAQLAANRNSAASNQTGSQMESLYSDVLSGKTPADEANQMLGSLKLPPLSYDDIRNARAQAALRGANAADILGSRNARILKLQNEAGLPSADAEALESATRWIGPDAQDKIFRAVQNATDLRNAAADASKDPAGWSSQNRVALGAVLSSIRTGMQTLGAEAEQARQLRQGLWTRLNQSPSQTDRDMIHAQIEALRAQEVQLQSVYGALAGTLHDWNSQFNPAANPPGPAVPPVQVRFTR